MRADDVRFAEGSSVMLSRLRTRVALSLPVGPGDTRVACTGKTSLPVPHVRSATRDGRDGARPLRAYGFFFCCAFSILAHESRSETVRLKTSFSSVESGSTQK